MKKIIVVTMFAGIVAAISAVCIKCAKGGQRNEV